MTCVHRKFGLFEQHIINPFLQKNWKLTTIFKIFEVITTKVPHYNATLCLIFADYYDFHVAFIPVAHLRGSTESSFFFFLLPSLEFGALYSFRKCLLKVCKRMNRTSNDFLAQYPARRQLFLFPLYKEEVRTLGSWLT